MGILNNGNYPNEGEPKSSRECKPDYEAMIKRANEKMAKAAAFRGAVFDFLEDRRIPDALVMIVGELDFEIFRQQKTIERLIEQQEREK